MPRAAAWFFCLGNWVLKPLFVAGSRGREGFGDRAGNREVVEVFQDVGIRCVEARFIVWETGP